MTGFANKLKRLIGLGELDVSKIGLTSNNFTNEQKKDPSKSINDVIIRLLTETPKRSTNALLKLLGKTEEDFSNFEIIPLKIFNTYGCPESTDIDVICLVESRKHLKWQINMDQLKEELEKLGYDTGREIDINLAYVENGIIQELSKGGKETQNILFHTYKYHKQSHPCFVKCEVDIELNDKIPVAAKFILDYLEVLIGDEQYGLERENKKKQYSSGQARVDYAVSLMSKIQFQDTYEWKSAMKSLVMKIIQLILLEGDQLEYTKRGLATKYNELYPNTFKNIIWFFTRGKEGEFSQDVMEKLFAEYSRIVKVHTVELEWKEFNVNQDINPTQLPDETIREFFKSPFTPTPQFVKSFEKIADGNRSINRMFPLKCFGFEDLPENSKDKIIVVDQRTDEWKRLLTYYTCGRNSGLIEYNGDEWVAFYYNLIRGAIMEMMIIHTVDFNHIIDLPNLKKAVVGFIVKDKTKEGSIAIAPDLLLYAGLEIIPVEIKCMTGPPIENRDFRRAVKLASMQLHTSVKILGGNKGIISILYIYEENGQINYKGKSALVVY
jgi:hypothetical protein